jgi:hypothetical protein
MKLAGEDCFPLCGYKMIGAEFFLKFEALLICIDGPVFVDGSNSDV